MPKSSDLDADYNFDGTSNRTEERQLSDHIQQCKDISVLRSEMRRKNREKQREYRLQLEAKVAALEAALIRRTRKHERDNLFGDDASKAIPGPEPFDMGEQFSRNVKPVVEESHLYQIAAQVPKGFHLHLPFEVERALELLRKMPRIPPHILRSTEPIFRDEHDAQRNFLHPAPVENGAPQDRLDRGVRIFEIPCIVAKHSTKSLGDYGAKQNFMSESYALRLGLSIDRTTVHKVTIGSGKYVNTTGTVSAPFRFKKEHETYDLKWHLLPNCIHDIVLGKQFLKASETFSNLSNWVRRVKEKVVRGISQFHLLYLGNSSPMFEGYVNGRAQTALADSGSKVLVMDKAYARHLGVDMHTGREHRTRLKFADGSSANTSGMAYGVEWRFGRDDEYTAPYQLDFHILENAPANVILCDTFLFDTRAFSRYQGFLLDDDQYDDDNDEGEFFAIDIDRKSKKGSGPGKIAYKWIFDNGVLTRSHSACKSFLAC